MVSTRTNLLDAALVEFSSNGFDGASTRAIAARAGCHQPQINYYFASKAALWEAALERLFALLAEQMRGIDEIADPLERFTEIIHRFVAFAARHPELNRIMVTEATAETARLRWMVDTYVRAAHARLLTAWRQLRSAGFGADVDERFVYHTLIGAASLLWANAPEARLLDPTLTASDEQVAAHARALIALFVPARSTNRKKPT